MAKDSDTQMWVYDHLLAICFLLKKKKTINKDKWKRKTDSPNRREKTTKDCNKKDKRKYSL